jgi:predicted amidohydrolase
MPAPLTLAVAQPVCLPCDVAANAAAHAEAVRAAAARVVVFPELSLTGYELAAPLVSVQDPRLWAVVEACRATGSIALAGAPVAGEDGRAYIAMLAIDAGGVRVAYRKVWVASSESHRFSAGEVPGVLEVDGWRLGLAICRDTGIARHASDTAALGVDAYVAGTLMTPDERAEQDQRASRIATHHRLWVAFASFAGPTGGGYDTSAGCSGVWDPHGRVVAQVGPQPGVLARAILQPS